MYTAARMPRVEQPPTQSAGRRVPLWLTGVLFALGGLLGFGAGVLSTQAARDFLRAALKDEQRADVSSRKSVSRPGFHFEMPGNWQIDTRSPDYDPDHQFSLETPGQSFLMFIIADAELDATAILEKHVDAQRARALKSAERSGFLGWGAHQGQGARLSGKYLGLTPGTVRIFVFVAAGRTYTVVESTYDEDVALVEPGFRLVERTFRVRRAIPRAPDSSDRSP
jgi:hypothetical protein